MKAVNLIPTDSKRSGARAATAPRGPGVALIALLVIALAYVTIYVLTSNTIKDRRAKIATVQSQVTAAQAAAARLTNYVNFNKVAANRDATVRQIATQRFDWNAALSDLSKVVPANTSLESLLGTVSPGATVNGAGGSSGSAVGTGTLRAVINAPAFEMKGCTATQDDVARLMSRLRLINGVQRVTLADSVKPDGATTGAAVTSASSGSASAGCPANWPSFDLVVFFQPLPGQSDASAGTSATATTTTTTTSTSTTSSASTTPTASASSGAQPVTATSSGGSK
jgi:Tfp pilus assembly protein PilN